MAAAVGPEWVCGSVELPYEVMEADGPVRPEAFILLDPEGFVVGSTVFAPGEAPSRIAEFFHESARKVGKGRKRPTRVRIASPDLAEALRRDVGARTTVICAPTPETEEPLAALIQHLNEKVGEASTYLTEGITEAAMARLFRAAAKLYRAQPWEALSPDQIPLSVRIAELDVDYPLTLLGAMGENFGFVLFRDENAMSRFVELSQEVLDGRPPRALPPHVFLELVPREELAPKLVDEVTRHRWEIASVRAYPELVAIDEDGERPLTTRELAALEAVALALVDYVSAEAAATIFPVETSQGVVQVELVVPNVDDEGDAANDSDDPFTEVVTEFARSREVQALDDAGRGAPDWARIFLELAFEYHDAGPEDITPQIVEEVVFEDIPRKVSCEPDAADDIVRAIRALLAFLGREHGLKEAAGSAIVLDAGAASGLRALLSDPQNFGMAKSVVMGGDQFGLEAMMKAKLARMMVGGPTFAPRPAPPKESRAKAKSKRKAQRAKRAKRRR